MRRSQFKSEVNGVRGPQRRSVLLRAGTLALGVSALPAGLRAQAPAAGNAIVLGQSVGLTGVNSGAGKQYVAGAKAHFDKLNAAGGVAGRRVELVTLDDGGVPARALANAKQLIDERRALALFGFFGSPQVQAAYPEMQRASVAMFGSLAGADELRGPNFPLVYSLRPGFSEEVAAIGRHVALLGSRRLVIVHDRDPESLAALDSAERVLTSQSVNVLGKVVVNVAQADAVMKQAAGLRPEAILLIAAASPAAAMVRGARTVSVNFRGPIYTLSNAGGSLLIEELGSEGAGMMMTRVTPRYNNTRLAVIREFQADAKDAKLEDNGSFTLEGYLAARVMGEALKRGGRELTRATLPRTLAGLDGLDLGGFRVNMNEGRTASRLVELSLIDQSGNLRE